MRSPRQVVGEIFKKFELATSKLLETSPDWGYLLALFIWQFRDDTSWFRLQPGCLSRLGDVRWSKVKRFRKA